MLLLHKLRKWHDTKDIALGSEILEGLFNECSGDQDDVYTPLELIELVKRWGYNHNITDATMQYAKMNEEVGEIAHALTRGNADKLEMVDAIGDTLVTLIIFADILGYDILDCLAEAYEQIRERTGETRNGSFVKDED